MALIKDFRLDGTDTGITLEGDAYTTTDGDRTVLALDGTGDFITTPASSDFDFGLGDFTYSTWIKTSQNSGYIPFFSVGLGGQGTSNVASLNIRHEIGYNHIRISSGATWWDFPLNDSSYDGNWHHIAVVRSSDSLSIYWDGEEIGSPADVSGQSFGSNTETVRIGHSQYEGSNTDYYLNGLFDDTRIYDTALSTPEVTLLYADLAISTDPTTFLPLDENAIDVIAGMPVTAVGSPAFVESDGTYALELSADLGIANVASSINSSKYLDLGVSTDFTNDWSISFWAKLNGQGGNFAPLFSIVTDEGTAGAELIHQLRIHNQESMIFGSSGNETGSSDAHWPRIGNTGEAYSGQVPDLEWHHVVVTRDAAAAKLHIYVDGYDGAPWHSGDQYDGFSSASRDMAAGRLYFGYAPAVAGQWGSTPAYWPGFLDEIVTYDVPLSSEEVQALYNVGRGITTFTFSETTTQNIGENNMSNFTLSGVDIAASGLVYNLDSSLSDVSAYTHARIKYDDSNGEQIGETVAISWGGTAGAWTASFGPIGGASPILGAAVGNTPFPVKWYIGTDADSMGTEELIATASITDASSLDDGNGGWNFTYGEVWGDPVYPGAAASYPDAGDYPLTETMDTFQAADRVSVTQMKSRLVSATGGGGYVPREAAAAWEDADGFSGLMLPDEYISDIKALTIAEVVYDPNDAAHVAEGINSKRFLSQEEYLLMIEPTATGGFGMASTDLVPEIPLVIMLDSYRSQLARLLHRFSQAELTEMGEPAGFTMTEFDESNDATWFANSSLALSVQDGGTGSGGLFQVEGDVKVVANLNIVSNLLGKASMIIDMITFQEALDEGLIGSIPGDKDPEQFYMAADGRVISGIVASFHDVFEATAALSVVGNVTLGDAADDSTLLEQSALNVGSITTFKGDVDASADVHVTGTSGGYGIDVEGSLTTTGTGTLLVQGQSPAPSSELAGITVDSAELEITNTLTVADKAGQSSSSTFGTAGVVNDFDVNATALITVQTDELADTATLAELLVDASAGSVKLAPSNEGKIYLDSGDAAAAVEASVVGTLTVENTGSGDDATLTVTGLSALGNLYDANENLYSPSNLKPDAELAADEVDIDASLQVVGQFSTDEDVEIDSMAGNGQPGTALGVTLTATINADDKSLAGSTVDGDIEAGIVGTDPSRVLAGVGAGYSSSDTGDIHIGRLTADMPTGNGELASAKFDADLTVGTLAAPAAVLIGDVPSDSSQHHNGDQILSGLIIDNDGVQGNLSLKSSDATNASDEVDIGIYASHLTDGSILLSGAGGIEFGGDVQFNDEVDMSGDLIIRVDGSDPSPAFKMVSDGNTQLSMTKVEVDGTPKANVVISNFTPTEQAPANGGTLKVGEKLTVEGRLLTASQGGAMVSQILSEFEVKDNILTLSDESEFLPFEEALNYLSNIGADEETVKSACVVAAGQPQPADLAAAQAAYDALAPEFKAAFSTYARGSFAEIPRTAINPDGIYLDRKFSGEEGQLDYSDSNDLDQLLLMNVNVGPSRLAVAPNHGDNVGVDTTVFSLLQGAGISMDTDEDGNVDGNIVYHGLQLGNLYTEGDTRLLYQAGKNWYVTLLRAKRHSPTEYAIALQAFNYVHIRAGDWSVNVVAAEMDENLKFELSASNGGSYALPGGIPDLHSFLIGDFNGADLSAYNDSFNALASPGYVNSDLTMEGTGDIKIHGAGGGEHQLLVGGVVGGNSAESSFAGDLDVGTATFAPIAFLNYDDGVTNQHFDTAFGLRDRGLTFVSSVGRTIHDETANNSYGMLSDVAGGGDHTRAMQVDDAKINDDVHLTDELQALDTVGLGNDPAGAVMQWDNRVEAYGNFTAVLDAQVAKSAYVGWRVPTADPGFDPKWASLAFETDRVLLPPFRLGSNIDTGASREIFDQAEAELMIQFVEAGVTADTLLGGNLMLNGSTRNKVIAENSINFEKALRSLDSEFKMQDYFTDGSDQTIDGAVQSFKDITNANVALHGYTLSPDAPTLASLVRAGVDVLEIERELDWGEAILFGSATQGEMEAAGDSPDDPSGLYLYTINVMKTMIAAMQASAGMTHQQRMGQFYAKDDVITMTEAFHALQLGAGTEGDVASGSAAISEKLRLEIYLNGQRVPDSEYDLILSATDAGKQIAFKRPIERRDVIIIDSKVANPG